MKKKMYFLVIALALVISPFSYIIASDVTNSKSSEPLPKDKFINSESVNMDNNKVEESKQKNQPEVHTQKVDKLSTTASNDVNMFLVGMLCIFSGAYILYNPKKV